jgi:hypothetical protein
VTGRSSLAIGGRLSPGLVTMGEVGGYLADGGCLPAFGH